MPNTFQANYQAIRGTSKLSQSELYLERETDRRTDRDRDKERQRQTETETERQRQRDRDRYKKLCFERKKKRLNCS